MSVIDEIKRKINVIDLLKEYIELKKAGANWKALCPFHSEKTPSFMASEDKQIWHCFGCNEGGDIFGFIMRMEGIDFPEALRILAKRAGVPLGEYNPAENSQRSKITDILDVAAGFYSGELLKSPQASDYIKARGLLPETVAGFRLGFAPQSWDAVSKFLLSRGFNTEDIAASGLVLQRDGGGHYDRFRGRVMFPIWNHSGEIAGFTARILPEFDDGKSGKYINTPETLLYKKSEIIYGLNFAKHQIKKDDLAVLVEGNMDVISLHQAGYKNVVATSGTALTSRQIELLKRYTQNIIMSFDADAAGIEAALRGIDIALSCGMNVKVFQMPKNADGMPLAKDPDELIKKYPEAWQKTLSSPKHIIDFHIDSNMGRFNMSEPHEAAEFCRLVAKQIKKINTSAERALWFRKLSDLTRVPEENLKEMAAGSERGNVSRQPIAAQSRQKNNAAISPEYRFLAAVLSNPSKFAPYFVPIRPEAFFSPEAREFYSHFILYYNEKAEFNEEDFRERLAALGAEPHFYDKLLLLKDKEFEADDALLERELKILAGIIRENDLKNQRKALEFKMAEAERQEDRGLMRELLEQFRKL